MLLYEVVMVDTHMPPRSKTFGLVGFGIASIALVVLLVALVGGPFTPRPTIGVSLGEIAGEAGRSAVRNFLGMPKEQAAPAPFDIDRLLWLVSMVGGALGAILGSLALILREDRLPATLAMTFGFATITLQLISGAFLIVAGLVLILALMAFLANTVPDIFG
jgi:hypothetical protein